MTKVSNFFKLVLLLCSTFFFGGIPVTAQIACTNNLLGNYSGFELTPGTANFGTSPYTALPGTDLRIINSGSFASGVGQVLTNTSGVPGAVALSPHSGNQMLVAHPKSNNDRLWFQNITVVPGYTYTFCFWAANIKANPPSMSLDIYMNGTKVTSGSINYGSWTQVCGSYTVPAGVTTIQIAITDPLAGSDGAAGKSHFIAVDDLCLQRTTTLTLSNLVWEDVNNNGLKDASESGVAGVTVNLYNSSGTLIATTVTDTNGLYQFTGLAAGTYSVGIVLPSGYVKSDVGTTSIATDDQNDGNAVVSGEVKTDPFTLTNSSTNIDFGIYKTACLGDFVWNDLNANGVQDAGEPGISGVTVTLSKPDGTTATTTTDANGAYSFCGLAPGTYSVSFATPSGYTATGSNVGGDDAKDSDPVGGTVTGIVLTSGETNNSIDAGYYKTACLGDFVWNDLNANGVQDAGEPGIAGVTVTLSKPDGTTATTTTNANGAYSFCDLAPGTYSVSFATPSGYTATGSNVGGDDAKDSDPVGGTVTGIVLTSGETNNSIDAGYYKTACLGDFVWNDLNANGVQDAGEPGIAGVTVTLSKPDGTTATTTTNANGAYSFCGLAPGTYSVSFATPSGYTATGSNVGGDDAKDSDPVGGTVTGIVLTSGETNNSIDAGYYKTACLGDFVWNDLNGNGVQDAGEPGIAGVTVTLTKPDGTTTTTTTDANGAYSFCGLAPGTYSVSFATPSGYAPTGSNLGGNDAKDSDPVGGTVTGITLASGETNNTIDAGYYKTACLGDFVWNDLNGNGVQDAGEPGIAGVTVTLTKPDGTTTTTTTDANGAYSFCGLAPGTYSVSFATPSGYAPTGSNLGGNDAKDSDPVGGTVTGITLASGETNNTIDAGYTFICTKPVLYNNGKPLPENITVECTAPAAETLTASDNCGNVPVDFKEQITPGDCANKYIVTRTWTATNSQGQTTTHTQTITVTDNTAPELTVPADAAVSCDNVPAVGTATATDKCDAAPKVTYLGEERINGNCAGNYKLIRSWKAEDACGNSVTKTQTITVTDNTAPELTVPADAAASCDNVPAAGTATATDKCDAAPKVTYLGETRVDGNCA
ncbi:SdrD B-like domain-containing protein, partial [Lacibacter luteus]|uniref:SdrD B-like domain-containing protein n=1 Tax=Lacibacter luteus TaxID=2508719 RepID=UPI00197B5AE7